MKENKGKQKAYWKKYYEKNKEKVHKQQREYYERNKESINKYRKEYYQEHKEEIYKAQQKYFAKNRQYITKLQNAIRKRNAEKYKAEGQMYCWLHKTERQNKMVQKLCRERGFSEEESRKLLEERNWNIISLIESTYEIYDEEKNLITKCTGKKDLVKYFGGSINNINNLLRSNNKQLIRIRNRHTKQWNYFIEV